MLRSPTALCSAPGVGGPTLLATLRKLAALLARTNVCGPVGGGDGGSTGSIETRPAISDTRCCDERRRGRGVGEARGEDGVGRDGDRGSELERLAGDKGRGEEGRDWIGELVTGPEMKLPELVGRGVA